MALRWSLTTCRSGQPYNDFLQQVEQASLSYGSAVEQAVRSAPGQAFQVLEQQVSTLAYTDVFFIIALLSLSITVVALFMSNVTPGAGAGGGG